MGWANKGGGSIVRTRAIEEGRNIKVAQPARFELRPVHILSHFVFLIDATCIGTVCLSVETGRKD